MKKFVIYLLTFMMVFSPMTAFAAEGDPVEDEGQVPVEELQDQDAEVTEEAAPAEDADAVDAVEEAAPAEEEEAVVEEASEEEAPAVEEEAAVEEEQEVYLKAAEATGEAHWEGNKYLDADGKAYTGLFKAPKKNGATGNGLYYAEADGTVNPKTRIVTVTTGDKYQYIVTTDGIWDKVNVAGPLSYLVYEDKVNNDCSIVANKGIWGTDEKYYVGDKGMARTEAGLLTFEGKNYFVNPGGKIQTGEAIVYDPSVAKWRYVKDGFVQTGEAIFTYGGKYWYRDTSGYVNKAAAILVTYKGSTQYYTNSDGSLYATANQMITLSNGLKYITGNGGAISKVSGPVKFNGNYYVAEPGGAIHTTKGFYNYNGNVYYITNDSGVLKVNSSFKVSGKKYHALATGAIAVGVHKWTNGKYYYSTSSGALRKKAGIVTWNGNRYHVNKKGKVTTNKKVKYKKKYYVAGKNGVIYKGLFTWKKNLYYANSKGVLKTKAGAFTYDGARYATNGSGKVYRDTKFTAGGKTYIAQKDGKLRTGHIKYNKKYYLTDSKGAVITKAGIYGYNKKSYYVRKGGALLVSDFFEYKDKYYYAGSDGAILKTTFKAKGYTWHPNSKTGEISVDEYSRIDSSVAPKKEENPA